MPLTDEDFPAVTADNLQETLDTSFGPSGERGSPEFASSAAEFLTVVYHDIFYDYQSALGTDGAGYVAAQHANISSLQSAADYAGAVLKTLANNPDLLAQVEAAMAAEVDSAPKLG